jgi:hypothetical protein
LRATLGFGDVVVWPEGPAVAGAHVRRRLRPAERIC